MNSIIIADDEINILQGLKSLVESFDLDINVLSLAQDGQEAFDKCMIFNPDILIIDINMPKLNGLQCLQKIIENNQKPKIIILSSYDNFKYAQSAIEYNVEAYLLKPVDELELYNLLNKFVCSNENVKDKKIDSLNDYKKNIIEFINFNYQNADLSSEMIENKFNISRTTIFNVMKQITDKSLNEYITMIRIKKSIELIKDNENIQIKEIAFLCGYYDQHYFSRVFKKNTGYSPSDYKKILYDGINND